MKTKWLFPHSYRLIGWIIFLLCVLVVLPLMYGRDLFNQTTWAKLVQSNDVLFHIAMYEFIDEIAAVGIIIGLLLIAFSREKTEDEMISQLRLEALQWSVYANYIILIIAIITVYDMAFFNVMIYNMFTVLLVFIARFRWLIFGTTIIHARYEKSTEG